MGGLSVLILGAGGVGGYLGVRASEAGGDVTFLVREARARQIDRDGLQLVSPLGDYKGPAKTVTAGKIMRPADVVVLAPKAFGLEAAIDAVSPAVGENTKVISFLNGIAHVDLLRSRFGESRVIGGIAHLPVRLRDDGAIEHLADFASFVMGPLDHADRDDMKPVQDFVATLQRGGVDARFETGIGQSMWTKFVFIATLAGATCLMRAPIGDILSARDGERLVLELLDECRSIAVASGVQIGDDDLEGFRRQLTQQGSMLTASMFRDVEAGRPTEWRHILGDLSSRATRLGIAHPNLKVAAMHLEVYEHKRERLGRT